MGLFEGYFGKGYLGIATARAGRFVSENPPLDAVPERSQAG
jgi:hypothetical protein